MNKFRNLLAVLMLAAFVLSACGSQGTQAPAAGSNTSGIDCMGAKSGDTISEIYQWSGTEEQNWNSIVKPLVDACGIVLKPDASRDQALLGTRVDAGTPPDIAFYNVAQLIQYQAKLKDMNTLGAHAENIPAAWQKLGTYGGKWVGLPVKSDTKTVVWYDPANFKSAGYEVPKTWNDLNTLVEKMVSDGKVPWSMGFESGPATGWTGTDWIEDILLVTKGPDFINGLIDGSVPYNDPAVKDAYTTYGKWATDSKYTVGGAKGTESTGFLDAIYKPFSDPPEAMMVKQSGFASGAISAQFKDLKYGTDYAFFELPGAQGVQIGADWLMAFSDKPAVKALVAYLTSTAGGQKWAEVGFDLSPNKGSAGHYADPAAADKAKLLSEAPAVVADYGDAIPGGFGSAEFKALVDYVNGGNLDQILATVAAAQKTSLGK
jgi:alpha-glucoside transport system substrate-binding protein